MTNRILMTVGTIFLAILSARADSVLGTSQGTGAFAVSSGQSLAQPFVLNVSAKVTNVQFKFGSAGTNSQFIMELTNAIGAGATSANVLAQATFTFSGPFNQTLTLPVGLTLKPGTYYLVATTASGLGGGWNHAGQILSSNLGSVPLQMFSANGAQINAGFAPGSAWTSNTGGADFEVHGTAVVPEPTTALLLVTGAISAAGLRLRKSRPQA